MGPRLTVSIHTVERSTLGTAGFNREIAIVATIKPRPEAAMTMMRRLRFFAAMPTRGTSIEERFDANPAGRTIVSSFGFRCGTTVGSKLSKCPRELDHCICRAYQWHGSGEDEEYETNCFYEKIVSCFVLKILTADIPKTRRPGSDASSPVPVKRHRAIIAVNHRKPVALASN
jgi:hypothetical protein